MKSHVSILNRLASSLILLTLASALVSAHDLFFRARNYHLAAGSDVLVDVYSGTFSESENAVTRDRLVVLEVVTAAGRTALPRDRWDDTKPQKSVVRVTTGAPGTYVVGAYLQPRYLELSGEKFNAYLKEEGIDEILSQRRVQKRLGEPSKERYQKFVKTLLHVGGVPTDNATTALGYDAEIVPEQNPYSLEPGDTLTVRCVVKGGPWANKIIFAGGRLGTSDRRISEQRLTTDEAGRARVRLTDAGVWYVRFVAMVEVDGDGEANYESRWSTITFAVGVKNVRRSGHRSGH